MQVGTGAGGLPVGHALGEQSGDQPGQHVAGPGGRQPGRCRGVDRGAAVLRRDDCIRPLQQHHGTGTHGCGPGSGKAVGGAASAIVARAGRTKHAGELAGVRRQHRGAAECLGRAREGGERVGVDHHTTPGPQQVWQRGPRRRRPQARATHPHIPPRIGEQRVQRGVTHQQAWRAGSIDVAALGGGDRDQSGAGVTCGLRRKPCRAGHFGAADHGDMAARVFVAVVARPREGPELREIGEAARLYLLQHRFGQADVCQGQRAAQLPAGQQQVAGLQAEESDRQRGLRRVAADCADGAVDAAGHIDGDHAPCRTQRLGDQSVDVAGQAGTEHRIDHEVGARRLGRVEGQHRTMPAQRGRSGVGARARRRQRGRRHRPAPLRQQARGDIAVAAVVARACQHQRPARREARLHRARHGPPGVRHQRWSGHPQAG